jgi:hypothetical protein
MSTPSFTLPRAACAAASLCLFLFPAIRATAQTIPNPSFETDTFVNFPGYAHLNGGVITGWTSTTIASVGLNPGGGTPFADNGTIPAGLNVAFLQSTAGGTNLSTTITGLTSGTAYRVNFRANARGGQAPNLKVQIDAVGQNVSLDFNPPAANVVPTSVNSTNPYHHVSFEFTPTSGSAVMTLINDAAGDNTVCVDNFSIQLASAAPPAAITATRWTGDGDSGVNSSYRYTHAYVFGGAQAYTTLNGVLFNRCDGANPNIAGKMTWTGFTNLFGEQTRTMTGSSNAIGRSFFYGGPNTAVTIRGLRANTTYVATIYGVGWENNVRAANFSVGGAEPTNVNLDAFGVTNGITVRCRYTTDSSGSAVLLDYPQAPGDGSFHTAAFTNREASPGSSPNTWTTTAWSNNATSGVNDGATYQYTHAYNFGAATNAVINGVTFVGKAGGNPSDTNFSTSGFANVFNNDGNNVTDVGGSRTLANDFLYNGFPGALTLTGLTPGTEYHLTLFSVGWEASGRTAQFVGYDQVGAVLDQDTFGDNNGIRIGYTYTAPASGSITVTTNPQGAGSIHLYGFANRKTAPETTLAVTSHPQPQYVTTLGGTATFTSTASGNLPLTYQWKKNGNPIPSETGTTNLSATLTLTNVGAGDVADYTCSFTGSGGQGTVTSNPAHLFLITDRVAGLFDTGVGTNCAVLPDGGQDPHYLITVNPDGASLIPGIVHDSTVFPIVAGPWLANNAVSKWISPQFNSSGSAGLNIDAGAGPGVYVYRTTFNLTGFDLSTVRITGNWATDNLGVEVRVNGTIVAGLTNSAQFVTFTPFQITSSNAAFVTGSNTLEFRVQNQDATAGYTGLRVEGLQGFGSMNPNTAPYIAAQPASVTIPWLATNTLCISAAGSATLTYQWYKDNQLVSGATSPILSITADNTNKAGVYTCTVTNGSGNVTSNTATVTFTGVPFSAGSYTMALDIGISGKVAMTTLVGLATGGAGPVSFAGLPSATSTNGGSVTISGGWIVYQPPVGFSGADSFNYFIEDGVNTVTGTVNVAIASGIGQTQNMVGITNEGAGKRILCLGIPGRTYQVQMSSDLTNWTPLGPPQVTPASGVISILDPGPLPPTRFYRTAQVP